MNEELCRIKTFINWPSTANFSALTLARCGFIYTGTGDRVECYRCRCQLENWRRGDDVDTRHRQSNFLCPVVLGTDQLNAVPAAVTVEPPAGRSRCVEDAVHTGNSKQQQQQQQRFNRSRPSDAELQQLRRHLVRLSTFHDWFKVPAARFIGADELARAGFYYTGHGDTVRCAFCRGGLQDWKEGDGAMTEHQRLDRYCQFVTQNFCQLTRPPPPPATAAVAADRPTTNQQPVDTQRLRAENALLVEDRTCRICRDSNLEVAFIPCGHVSCWSCSVRFNICHTCRDFIIGKIPLRFTTIDGREHIIVIH